MPWIWWAVYIEGRSCETVDEPIILEVDKAHAELGKKGLTSLVGPVVIKPVAVSITPVRLREDGTYS